ncbi:hypothetical protein ASPCADRAFT_57 [Aspergillus carbonarius ITEM 5010]|uniref:J domain-containing protein n=1 Tax=Aspergillus carbonarius (strain ITEM 5010) TaxID=602072 RepID=A0A1R3S0R0_ASPC5|nr:hypothetical protein ASPCADRAFT_57 [Aspergillus carbonarius ITEM 5010]
MAVKHLYPSPQHPPLHCTYSSTLHNTAKSNPSSLPWPPTQDLTPYNILNLRPSDPYTKAPFYNLVKIYHPDRYHTVPSNLSPATREHRYRLVLAAHELLSDPQKRLAYDRYGVGWAWAWAWAHGQGLPRAVSISKYSAHGTDSRKTDLLLSHPRLIFLLFVIVFFLQCCLFVVHSCRAGVHARMLHDQCQRLLERRRSRAAGLGGLGAQFEGFLLRRDPSGLGLTRREALVYRDVLPYCAYNRS